MHQVCILYIAMATKVGLVVPFELMSSESFLPEQLLISYDCTHIIYILYDHI